MPTVDFHALGLALHYDRPLHVTLAMDKYRKLKAQEAEKRRYERFGGPPVRWSLVDPEPTGEATDDGE